MSIHMFVLKTILTLAMFALGWGIVSPSLISSANSFYVIVGVVNAIIVPYLVFLLWRNEIT